MAISLPLALVVTLVQARTAFADEPWVNAPAGPVAREIQPVYWILFFFAVIVLLIVDGGIVMAAIRFRERPGHTAQQFHGHNLLELTWTLVPTLMVIGFTVLSAQKLQIINDTATGENMTIEVVGKQWAWEYKYPQEPRFALQGGGYLVGTEELHIPVGQKIRLVLSSTDVIHDFFVPQVGGKKDAVPGRETEMWIQADQPGTYKGQCAEFCGEGHADMLIVLVAHTDAEYARWAQEAVALANRLNDPATREGKDLFASGACAGCHAVRGLTSGRVGPPLDGIASKGDIAGVLRPVDEANLVRWIANPPAVKPGTQMPALGLPEEDIRKITQFLLTLR